MFKKNEPETFHEDATVTREEPPPARSGAGPATIGPSISIRGDLSGDEDLVIQGKVEGTISLREHVVTVGKDGQVNATVNARVINVEGRVEGDLHGNEQVVVRRSGNVEGNISAPRVTLEDNCRFKGSIDMDARDDDKTRGATVADIKPAGAEGQKPGASGTAEKSPGPQGPRGSSFQGRP